MLPINTQTYFASISSSTTITAINKPCTILGYQVLQDKPDSKISIIDGTDIISYSYAVNTPYIELNYICKNNITIKKEGTYNAFITINYLPYSISSTTTQTFTAGEIVMSLFLFWIFAFLIFQFIIFKFLGKHKKL